MAQLSSIEWTDVTWNPIRGCSRVSEGCRRCYAERVAARFIKPGQAYEGLAHRVGGEARWTGKVQLVVDNLEEPLFWRKPRKIFVNSMSDMFHEKVRADWIRRILAIAALTPQHTYQILTKRSGIMLETMAAPSLEGSVKGYAWEVLGHHPRFKHQHVMQRPWPLPNVWLGVSVENQAAADERIPHLLATPAAVRFLSCEPLLGPIDLTKVRKLLPGGKRICWVNSIEAKEANAAHGELVRSLGPDYPYSRIDWVISGGESGAGARPSHSEEHRSLRDQCVAAGVPFFFKQWGEWISGDHLHTTPAGSDDGKRYAGDMHRVGKKAAGRILDGRTWDEFPKVAV